MHVHLPKPLHGWRALIGEVGIIVVGVLIALGAEQVVEDYRWHQKVDVVRKSIMGELANDRGRWEVDMIEARCMTRNIERLDRWAHDAGPGAAVPTAPPGLPGGFFWMHSANWNLATASQTLDHFPIDEQLAFAALYDGVTHRQVDIQGASDLSDRVRATLPLASDSQGRRELRSTLAALNSKVSALLSNEGYMKRHFDAVRVKPDRSDFAADFTGATCAF